MKKSQVAWLNNDADLRPKSRQPRIGKNQLSSAREATELARKHAGKIEKIIAEARDTETFDEQEVFIDTPVFNDPRCLRDRRVRQSVFFTAFRDRRNEARRGLCSLDTNWWISRNYCQPNVE